MRWETFFIDGHILNIYPTNTLIDTINPIDAIRNIINLDEFLNKTAHHLIDLGIQEGPTTSKALQPPAP